MEGKAARRKRGYYQVYLADKSVPKPKVSLWRFEKKTETAQTTKDYDDCHFHDSTASPSLDHVDPADFLDAFHKETFDDIMTDHPRDLVEDFDQTDSCPNALFENSDEEFLLQDEDDEDSGDDEACRDDSQTEDSLGDQPLYTGATITLAASMILIISFAMRHALTGEALADLLVLLELHCLSPNLCSRNLRTFMNFFSSLKSPLEFHYYCEKCLVYHGTEKQNMCQKCGTATKKRTTSYFLVIPVVSQLSSLFADGTLIQHIKDYKSSVEKRDDRYLSDITDGRLYKERFQRDGYFQGSTPLEKEQLHISFQMNTDGVSLFRSSNFSIWPVYFVINELPPHLRFSRSNRIFAGLWFGYSKPDFGTFLRPFAESLHDIYLSGLSVNGLRIRGILLNGVFDAPARCLFQNMVQFNGFHGCPYCFIPGKTFKTSERGHSLVYPFNMDSANGHHELRTHTMQTQQGQQAEMNKTNGGGSVYGAKGLTWFHFLPHFDIVRGTSLDYMHCVLLGVMKMLMTLWFDKSHRNEPFNISSRISDVDRRLMQVKPPSFISRLPRSLAEVTHYKAAELKNFLLFYSLPCLFGVLPDDQYHHLTLLVYAIYSMLKDRISAEDIHDSRKKMMEFVLNLPVLYGERYLTSNIHLLLHLADKVEDLGPLWCSSCFYFEDFNGQLRRLFHGTQSIETQIAFAVCVHQKLPQMSAFLQYGSCEKDFFKKMMEKKTQSTKEVITDNISVVGAYYGGRLTDTEQCLLSTTVGQWETVSFFNRVCVGNQLVHSKQCKTTTRRNNTIVRYRNGNMHFGQVEHFIKVKTQCPPHCPSSYNKILFYAIINVMNIVADVADMTRSTSHMHMVPLQSSTGQLAMVPLQDICDVCICASVHEDLHFVSVLPNRIEKE